VATVATSLKLPRSLKLRISRIAKSRGETTHATMLRLLEERVEDAERYERFLEDARAADRQMLASGEAYAADDVHRYLSERVDGIAAARPKPATWRR
jgi:predicted DNA-binding protein